MNFKALFRPRHQHPDPQVRMASISALDPENAKHKSALHELAFNDADISVRVSALERLNSFTLWYKVLCTESAPQLQRKARAEVEKELLTDENSSLSPKQRLTFIRECTYLPLLQQLVKLPDIQQQETLCVQLLEKLHNRQLNLDILLQSCNERLQFALLGQLQDEKSLLKISKKAINPDLAKAAFEKLTLIKLQKSKPKAVREQFRMILSRMLALETLSFDGYWADCRQELEQQYQHQLKEIHVLPEDEQQQIQQKHQVIISKLASCEQNKAG